MLSIASPAFRHGEPIPKKYSQEGKNISPPLEWAEVPVNTRELVLICEDPDAPKPEPVTHWLLYGLEPSLRGLPEAFPVGARLTEPAVAVQGLNTSGDPGYMGPMPPKGHGEHRYFFRLYAIDTKLDLQPGLSKDVLLQKLGGHVLAVSELIGTYQRGRPRTQRYPEVSVQL